MTAPTARTQQRFTFIDALRGVAAMAVVIDHAIAGKHIPNLMLILPGRALTVMTHGYLGVAIFFVLSGFVIAHSVYFDRVTPEFALRFMARRSVRLDPPYWLAIALALGSAVLSATAVAGKSHPAISGGQLLAHVFYLQEALGYQHVNIVFWTLCYEVQFYIVYVGLLALAQNDPRLPLQGPNTTKLLAMAALFSLLWPVGVVHGGPWPGCFLNLWSSFLLGAGAYWTWRNPQLIVPYLAFVAVLAVAALARPDPFSLLGVMTALAILAVAASGQITTALNWPWLQFLGKISYSLYLVHNPVTGAVFRIGYGLTGHSTMSEAFWWMVSLAACVVVAFAVWWCIEAPSMRLARMIPLRPAPERFAALPQPA